MRRLMVGFLAAILLAGCSSSIPRYSAVFSPTVPPPTASAPPAGSSPAAAVDTSAWITVAPQGEGFSILIPCAATPVSESATAAGVGTYLYTYWSCTDSSGRVFLVSLTKFAAGTLSGPAKPNFDYTEQGYVKNLPAAQVESQSDLTLGGHPGRTVVIANSTTREQGEMVIVGDTEYLVGVGYPVGLADDGVVNAFMASFKLTV